MENLKELFTPTEVLNEVKTNDTTVGMIGYVHKIDSNPHSAGNKFYKVVLNNGDGYTVQIIAWNENISILNPINTVNTVVQIKNAVAKIPKQISYNLGNSKYELQIKSHSSIAVIGVYESDEANSIEQVSIQQVPSYIGKTISVSGYIKTNFNIFKYKSMNFFLGSIADLHGYKLEVKTSFDSTYLGSKGMFVGLIGTVELHKPGPPCLSVTKEEHFVVNEKEELASFETLLDCYKTVM